MEDFSDATNITMNTYQQIAGLYADTHTAFVIPLFWSERMQHFADVVRNSPAYQQNPALPIVDIGCGPGRDALLLARMGFAVLATDLSEEMLDEAKKRTLNQPGAERITFRRMDMRQLELADASCAGLWVSASFLHIPKRENLAVLQELVRVLPDRQALSHCWSKNKMPVKPNATRYSKRQVQPVSSLATTAPNCGHYWNKQDSRYGIFSRHEIPVLPTRHAGLAHWQ